MASEARQAVLIDTDIGDDVDDAFGLALAIVLPELRLCGVTTVGGPVDKRALLARIILDAGRQPEVPVALGSSAMSDGRAAATRFSHQPVLEHVENVASTARPGANAASSGVSGSQAATDLILERSYHDAPLTLIALGPLTNIAAALERDPSLARRVRLVAMAGKLGLPYPDWNLRCDPQAARRVLSAGMPTTLVGMHVTLRCKMRLVQLRRLLVDQRPLAVALSRCVLAWRTWKRRMPILHDALTVAVAAEPSLVRTEPRRVRVLQGGFSSATRERPANALVCTAVDLARFHQLLDTALFGDPTPATSASGPLARLVSCIV